MPQTTKAQIVLTQEQYEDLIRKLDELGKVQNEIKLDLAARKHIDEKVDETAKLIAGNGKPGFVAIRDKVMAWEVKINAIALLVLGDLVMRIVSIAVSFPK